MESRSGIHPRRTHLGSAHDGAGHALGGLIAAQAGRFTQNGTQLLVDDIGWALKWKNIHEDPGAVRTADNAEIVDALIALYEACVKRRSEQQQPGRAEREPAAHDDVGWES
jgi:hypothetical protein